jgi:hypothetical protein
MGLQLRNCGPDTYVVLSGTGGEWFTWAVGGFNNWIDSGESFSETSNQLVGRVTWVPAVSEDESNLLHFGLGLRHSDINYRHISLDREGLQGNSSGINARILLKLD